MSKLTVTRREQLKALLDRVISAAAQTALPTAQKTLEGHPTYINTQAAYAAANEGREHLRQAAEKIEQHTRARIVALGFKPDGDDARGPGIVLHNVLDFTGRCYTAVGDDTEVKIRGMNLVFTHTNIANADIVTVPLFSPETQEEMAGIEEQFTLATDEKELIGLIAHAGICLKEVKDAQGPGNSVRDGSRPKSTHARKEKRAVRA